jgi:hypothetical protein
MEVIEERFWALARSSPWRWSSLQFVRTRRGRDQFGDDVRAWLRRPGALRVEDLDGHLLQIEMGSAPRTVGLLTSDGGRELPLRPPSSVTPVFGADGLVRERPSEWDVDFDDPLFQDYAWVAMLDPVELADGEDGRPGTTLEGLRTVELRGPAGGRCDRWPSTSPIPRVATACQRCTSAARAPADVREELWRSQHVRDVLPRLERDRARRET